MARTSLFAHLLGAANLRTAAKKMGDDDYDKDMEKDDVQDDDDPSMEGDDDHQEPDGDEPKGKKAKAKSAKAEAEDDDAADSDDHDDDGKAKARAAGLKAGRKAERARCRAIFMAKEAAGRPDLAAQLAFETDMAAEAAIAVMATAGPVGGGLGDRMAKLELPNPGGNGGDAPSGKPSLAARMLEVGRKTGRVVAA